MKKVKKALKWALILVVLYVLYIVGMVYFGMAIPMQRQAVSKAPQGVAVFTGTRARLAEGFRLLKQYPQTQLLISGVNEGTSKKTLMQASRVPCCVSYTHVTLDYAAQDTNENAIETAKWAQSKGIKQLYLVTSNYHMPRSLLELHHSAPDLTITAHAVIAKEFQNNTWWKDSKLLRAVIHECNKYPLAWLRCKFETYWA